MTPKPRSEDHTPPRARPSPTRRVVGILLPVLLGGLAVKLAHRLLHPETDPALCTGCGDHHHPVAPVSFQPVSAPARTELPPLKVPPLIDARDLLALGLARARELEPTAVHQHSGVPPERHQEGIVDTRGEKADPVTMSFTFCRFEPTAPPGKDVVTGTISMLVSQQDLTTRSSLDSSPSRDALCTRDNRPLAHHVPTCPSVAAWGEAVRSGMPSSTAASLRASLRGWELDVEGHAELSMAFDLESCAHLAPRTGPLAWCESALHMIDILPVDKAVEHIRSQRAHLRCPPPSSFAQRELDDAAIRAVFRDGCAALEGARLAASLGAGTACTLLPPSCAAGCVSPPSRP